VGLDLAAVVKQRCRNHRAGGSRPQRAHRALGHPDGVTAVGGAASAPVVAAHHREALVPASILMAMVGYALGNYLAVFTAQACYWISG
jgi:hypothetical protein